VKWAGHPDLAEDDLQTAYCQVAAQSKPERIVNRRTYFLRVLKNEALKRYAPRTEVPLDDLDTALTPAPPVDEKVCNSLRDQSWLERLAGQRDRLLAAIPARSGDPDRYQGLVYETAGQVLRDGVNGEPSDADSNDAFGAAFPEYFAQPRASANLLHQRLRRAREDVRALLQAVVSHDELI